MKTPPTACNSLASRPPSQATSARAPACDQRRRDVDRRALGAAGVEPRDDLQNGPAGEARLGAAEGGERAPAHARTLRRQARAWIDERLRLGEAVHVRAFDRVSGRRANHGGDLSVNQENPQFLDIGSGSSTRRIAFRRRAPAGSDAGGSRLARRLQVRHGFDQGFGARRPLRAAGPRLSALRLFRPWPFRRRFRGGHDLALARREPRGFSLPDRGPADPRRLVDGRLYRAAAGARTRQFRRSRSNRRHGR